MVFVVDGGESEDRPGDFKPFLSVASQCSTCVGASWTFVTEIMQKLVDIPAKIIED